MAPEVGSTLAVPATPATAGNDWHSQFITRVSRFDHVCAMGIARLYCTANPY